MKAGTMIKYPFVLDFDEEQTTTRSKPVMITLFVSSLDEAPEYYKGSSTAVYPKYAKRLQLRFKNCVP